mmetsp:Transcript_60363/g.162001  ORF Transcript_60363/g.162001 Transcript_60363/m.162001 type:complete len:275 (+) Transcript_60363:691-1515(+)
MPFPVTMFTSDCRSISSCATSWCPFSTERYRRVAPVIRWMVLGSTPSSRACRTASTSPVLALLYTSVARSSRTTSSWLFICAASTGVVPAKSAISMHAPRRTRICASSTFPVPAASNTGVAPSSGATPFTSPVAFSSVSAATVNMDRHAAKNRVSCRCGWAKNSGGVPLTSRPASSSPLMAEETAAGSRACCWVARDHPRMRTTSRASSSAAWSRANSMARVMADWRTPILSLVSCIKLAPASNNIQAISGLPSATASISAVRRDVGHTRSTLS